LLFTDITERKGPKRLLQIAHDELERRVEERTAELLNKRATKIEIAERKHVEERLRESESRHRMLVENAPLGIIWCDLQGRVIQVNSNLSTILGSPSPEKTRAINVLTHTPLVEAGVSAETVAAWNPPRVFECPYTSQWGSLLTTAHGP
jgi:PAS domain-containing protein